MDESGRWQNCNCSSVSGDVLFVVYDEDLPWFALNPTKVLSPLERV